MSDIHINPPFKPYILPTVEQLASPAVGVRPVMPENAEASARVIVDTMADFGIKVEVTHVEQGLTVTRYELVPAPGVRPERISGLAPNLQLNLNAKSVRIQAPITGRGTVEIEIPNASDRMVYLSDVLTYPGWRPDQMELPLALGKDVGGQGLVIDLARMPHLFIAGMTGSGKTVCLNSILAGLLMSRTPDEMHLMLVDLKIVELAAYRGLPHLEGLRKELITDPKKVADDLRWAIVEMERRYKLFASVGVRNIMDFNRRTIEKTQATIAGEETGGCMSARLPYIVIIVDELADLMLTAGGEIETYIARLAQMSRAVGIHMIVCTEMPSVNVITGTIKAIFPARIAFQVAQKVDSRTILDTIGAEKLLGRGDMLYQSPGASRVVRAQGAFTTDEEIARIVAFICSQCPAPTAPEAVEPESVESAENAESRNGEAPGQANDETPSAPPAVFDSGPATPNYEDMLAKGGADDNEDNAMIEQSLQIIRETRCASTSMLQRRLRIGYTRAARIMDTLEERGIVGPARGSDPGEILIDIETHPKLPIPLEPQNPQIHTQIQSPKSPNHSANPRLHSDRAGYAERTVRTMSRLISKSKYLKGLQCPKLLWTSYNDKAQIPETDAATQAIFSQGDEVGRLAQSLFPGGTEVAWNDEDFNAMFQSTKELLVARRPIYEATFAAGGALARADILNPVEDGRWDIIEVKSSTGVKPAYLEDVALQRHCYEAAGIPVRRCHLMHVNNQYVRHGEIDARGLFVAEDITEAVAPLLSTVGGRISEMQRVIALEICPVVEIGPHCNNPYGCPLKGQCWAERLAAEAAEAAVAPKVDVEYAPAEIREFLDSLSWPLYLLDFETIATAIPLFDDCRPYQKVPFQFSLDVVERMDAEPRHGSWLWDGAGDPRSTMFTELRKAIGTTGSVLAYSKSFEEGRLNESAEAFPEHAAWVDALMPRMVDLADPVHSHAVQHPTLGRKWSLKTVLPLLTDHDYNDLAIGDGMTAGAEFMRVMLVETEPDDRMTVRKNLEEYCGLDTYGMLEILRKLNAMSK